MEDGSKMNVSAAYTLRKSSQEAGGKIFQLLPVVEPRRVHRDIINTLSELD